MHDPDALVTFLDVRLLRTTPAALLCRVGVRQVWLPRRHVSGKLWQTGDRGKLFIRRWVADERGLLDADGVHARPVDVPLRAHPAHLHVVPASRHAAASFVRRP